MSWRGPGYISGTSWTYTLPAAIVVLSAVFYPLPMLATEVAFRRIDARLEEAALVVAPRRLVLRRILLPLAAPVVSAASLIVFVLAISQFGVPGLLRVRVYTTEVFTAFAALYDFSRRSCSRFRSWRWPLESAPSPRERWGIGSSRRAAPRAAIRRSSITGVAAQESL